MADQIRVKSGLLVGALVAGGVTVGTVGSAPSANATCASFFGIGNSADCTSNLTSIAIAIGTNAQAHADGLFGSAIAVGTEAEAHNNGLFSSAIATGPFLARAFTNDAFNLAVVLSGDESDAIAGGVFAIAVHLGKAGIAETGGSGQLGNIGANIAINIAPTNSGSGVPRTSAIGIGNIAVNVFGNASGNFTHEVSAIGTANIATNFVGNDNIVDAGSGGGRERGVQRFRQRQRSAGRTGSTGARRIDLPKRGAHHQKRPRLQHQRTPHPQYRRGEQCHESEVDRRDRLPSGRIQERWAVAVGDGQHQALARKA